MRTDRFYDVDDCTFENAHEKCNYDKVLAKRKCIFTVSSMIYYSFVLYIRVYIFLSSKSTKKMFIKGDNIHTCYTLYSAISPYSRGLILPFVSQRSYMFNRSDFCRNIIFAKTALRGQRESDPALSPLPNVNSMHV